MRRSLALAVGLLSVLGRCAPAYAQVAPLTSSVSSLTASSGGSGSGDIDSVAITASSPLTGTASCTTGACSFTLGLGTVTVAKGGTGLTAGTDGGILGYTATGTLASSIALTLHALLVGGGAGATPTPLGSLGTSTQVLHGAAAGDPTWGAIVNADITNATIDLTTKVTGALPVANGGSGIATTTAYSLVMSGTTATGAWAATIGPGTATQVLTSNGAGAYPTWQAAAGGISGLTAGRVPYAASATTLADSAGFTFASGTLTVPSEVDIGSLLIQSGSGGASLYATNAGHYISVIPNAFEVNVGASSITATNVAIAHLLPTTFTGGSAGVIPVVVKGAASQTGNLTEWQNSSSTVLASISAAGVFSAPKLLANGTSPTVGGSCGTGPAIAGKDGAGRITTGTGAPTSCTVTFGGAAWANAPSCHAQNETTANAMRAVATTTTVVITGTMIASDVVTYVCIGY